MIPTEQPPQLYLLDVQVLNRQERDLVILCEGRNLTLEQFDLLVFNLNQVRLVDLRPEIIDRVSDPATDGLIQLRTPGIPSVARSKPKRKSVMGRLVWGCVAKVIEDKTLDKPHEGGIHYHVFTAKAAKHDGGIIDARAVCGNKPIRFRRNVGLMSDDKPNVTPPDRLCRACEAKWEAWRKQQEQEATSCGKQ